MTRREDDGTRLARFRTWFRNSVLAESDWRKEARQDVEFYAGDQWDTATIQKLRDEGRAYITINKIRPMLNLLSGYQRLNRYQPEFLPRTADDLEKCKVADGVTRYVFDATEYESVESRVILDSWLTGRGWFYVPWKWDWEAGSGDIAIDRASPFDVYMDPEGRKPDLSDSEFVHFARWVTADKVISKFPEAEGQVRSVIAMYDTEEESTEWVGAEPLWYTSEGKKVRLVSTWYRNHTTEVLLKFPTGEVVPKDRVPEEIRHLGKEKHIPRTEIRVATYLGQLLLEDVESPYDHHFFPFVLLPAYWLGEGDTPAGVVRDLKDPQMELNKRRSQFMDIVNKMAGRGYIASKGSITEEDKVHWEKDGAKNGVILEYEGQDPPKPFANDNIPSQFFNIDQQSSQDLKDISNVNEAMLGTDVPASVSGRAMELRQRQAVTGLAMLFDEARLAKKRVLWLLWGKRRHKGLIPQYYKEPRVFRIIGDDGKQDFVPVNQHVPMGIDPMTGQAVEQILNDLGTFEFDISISDTPATPTQRVAAFYALLEMAKVGVQIPPDMIIEASDMPQKEALKQRLTQPQTPPQGQPGGGSAPGLPPGQPGAPPMAPSGQAPNLQNVMKMIAAGSGG